jgi:hypothetical protein
MVYAPVGRAVRVRMDKITGRRVKAWWFDPRTGQATVIGTFDNRGERDFMFAPNLRPGDRVAAGQLLGYVGDSGLAHGPHLHFELFAPDGLLVSPFFSLKAAGRVTAPRPFLADGATRPPAGEVRVEGCIRGWDPVRRVLTVLGVARQTATGRTDAYTFPTRTRFVLTPGLVASAGGDRAFYALPRDRPVTLYVEAPRGRRPGAVRRLVLPAASPE